MIIKINILAATSEQFLVILKNSLGMPVCQNKVLVVEIWVKTQFLPPFNGYKAKLQKYLLWFSNASIP